jgi:integrase
MAPKKARKKKVAAKRQAWNKGFEIGKKDAFTPDQVKRIRSVLEKRDASGLRDLALFSTAIDTMLQGHDLLELHVRDVQHRNGSIRSTIKLSKKRSGAPVRCALSRLTAKALRRRLLSCVVGCRGPCHDEFVVHQRPKPRAVAMH